MVTGLELAVAAMAAAITMRWSLAPSTVPAGDGTALNGEKIRPCLGGNAQSGKQGGGGLQPVALLHPQPGGVDKAGGAGPDRRHDRQGRQQIRNAGDIDLPVSGLCQAQEVGHHSHVSLNGKSVEPGQFQLGAQGDGSVPEGRLGPVCFHGPVKGLVGRRGNLKRFARSMGSAAVTPAPVRASSVMRI